MTKVLAVARRELRAYFNSPVAYVVLGIFGIAVAALFFFVIGGGVFVIGEASMRPLFSISPWLFMIVSPAVTMRLLAEERKSGTYEVLMTLPVREVEVVLGKFLAALGMVSVGILSTLPIPLSLAAVTAEGYSLDWGPVLGGYLGMGLVASTFLAVGMWASALTKNQIVGFIVGLALCFVLVMLDSAVFLLPESISATVQYFSVIAHFESISRGVIDSRDLVFYLSTAAIFLMGTVFTLQRARE
jgi:ABC-2 type transport system permease protein